MENSRSPEKILRLWRDRIRDKLWIVIQFNIDMEITRKIIRSTNPISLNLSLLESYVKYMINLNLENNIRESL
jgi:hypothetical protein